MGMSFWRSGNIFRKSSLLNLQGRDRAQASSPLPISPELSRSISLPQGCASLRAIASLTYAAPWVQANYACWNRSPFRQP